MQSFDKELSKISEFCIGRKEGVEKIISNIEDGRNALLTFLGNENGR